MYCFSCAADRDGEETVDHHPRLPYRVEGTQFPTYAALASIFFG